MAAIREAIEPQRRFLDASPLESIEFLWQKAKGSQHPDDTVMIQPRFKSEHPVRPTKEPR